MFFFNPKAWYVLCMCSITKLHAWPQKAKDIRRKLSKLVLSEVVHACCHQHLGRWGTVPLSYNELLIPGSLGHAKELLSSYQKKVRVFFYNFIHRLLKKLFFLFNIIVHFGALVIQYIHTWCNYQIKAVSSISSIYHLCTGKYWSW